jgi:indole-3-glycerol phosphate synthase
VAEAIERAQALVPSRAAIERAAADAPPAPPFAPALLRMDVAVIAEVKRRSPSKGAINPGIGAEAQAGAYAMGGAAALSILTEPRHFGGSDADLVAAQGHRLPLLKKDFHVRPLQVIQARALGASAVLLIARALDPTTLDDLVRLARAVGIEPLVEVRDAWELDRALTSGTTVVGVNSRNLETLEMDPELAARLVPKIPGACVAVHESGIVARDDVERAALAGADAVLVGSSLSAAPDPEVAVRDLTGVPRRSRGS